MADFDGLQVLAKVGELLGLVLLLGTMVAARWTLPPQARVGWALALGWALLSIASVGESVHALARMVPSPGWADVQDFMLHSHLGLASLVRVGLGLGCLLLAWPRWPRPPLLAFALGLGLLVTMTAVSHAWATHNWLARIADVLHLCGAVVWPGILLHAALLRLGSSLDDWRSVLPRLSAMALVSVAVLAVTGLYAAFLHIPTWSALWTRSYGRVLLVKLGLVGTILAIAAVNRYGLMKRLAEEGPARRLQTMVRIEIILVAAVLIVTGLLLTRDPESDGTDDAIQMKGPIGLAQVAEGRHRPTRKAGDGDGPFDRAAATIIFDTNRSVGCERLA